MEDVEGSLTAEGCKFGIVVSRFNSAITSSLLDGALSAIKRHGGDLNDVTVVHVPGSFEIPLAAKKLASNVNIDAVIALGAVIKGETDHYNYICSAVSSALQEVSLECEKPVLFGILTCDTVEQAMNRAGIKYGNAGYSTAVSAIEMANLMKNLKENDFKGSSRGINAIKR